MQVEAEVVDFYLVVAHAEVAFGSRALLGDAVDDWHERWVEN